MKPSLTLQLCFCTRCAFIRTHTHTRVSSHGSLSTNGYSASTSTVRETEKWWQLLFRGSVYRLRHNGVLLCVTELLTELLNFYGDILLCSEKGLLKCISTTHFLKKEQARIWNITIEGIKREERRKKSGMQSFFLKALPSPLEISLFADDLILQSSIHPSTLFLPLHRFSSAVANLFSGSIK